MNAIESGEGLEALKFGFGIRLGQLFDSVGSCSRNGISDNSDGKRREEKFGVKCYSTKDSLAKKCFSQ